MPEWGFRQFEVVSSKVLDDVGVVWIIDSHEHPSILSGESKVAAQQPMSLWEKMYELHIEMFRANSRLVVGYMGVIYRCSSEKRTCEGEKKNPFFIIIHSFY